MEETADIFDEHRRSRSHVWKTRVLPDKGRKLCMPHRGGSCGNPSGGSSVALYTCTFRDKSIHAGEAKRLYM